MPYVILSICSLSIVVAILTAARIVANAVRSTASRRVSVTAPSVLDYRKLAAEVEFHTGGYVKPAAKDGGAK